MAEPNANEIRQVSISNANANVITTAACNAYDFNKNANNHFVGVLNNSFLSPNILAKITMKGSYYSILMETDYNIVTEPRIYFGPVDIQKLKIQLVDETGNVLYMNNSNKGIWRSILNKRRTINCLLLHVFVFILSLL
jgi:hypothetical protein